MNTSLLAMHDAAALLPLDPQPSTQIVALAAETAHEGVRAYARTLGEVPAPAWAALSLEEQSQVVLAACGPTLGVSPELQHRRWVAARVREGWSPGEVLDRARKAHPNLCPWALLPESQRAKARLFVELVRGTCTALAPRG